MISSASNCCKHGHQLGEITFCGGPEHNPTTAFWREVIWILCEILLLTSDHVSGSMLRNDWEFERIYTSRPDIDYPLFPVTPRMNVCSEIGQPSSILSCHGNAVDTKPLIHHFPSVYARIMLSIPNFNLGHKNLAARRTFRSLVWTSRSQPLK